MRKPKEIKTYEERSSVGETSFFRHKDVMRELCLLSIGEDSHRREPSLSARTVPAGENRSRWIVLGSQIDLHLYVRDKRRKTCVYRGGCGRIDEYMERRRERTEK